ncbi:hydroxyethylthiazole kinase [Sediminibacillus massiliensis]|uniref:hydroxyethylthiazole kinase n=1 Tax=Sediminibacillus massiliensis TaxID=1926277 RepID=UPI001FE8C8F0|nr:hydroxyethylthiazole kinase [Sediminibacillus massiliensis]
MNGITNLLIKLREEKPLIHNITNNVVINFTANGLLALGASPVMANAGEEAADMAGVADALILNIGTLTSPQVEAMILAGKAANQKGIPVVFDPVGVGATPYRNQSAKRILDEVEVSIIRGNAGEIAFLAGVDTQMKGVDSAFAGNNRAIAIKAADNLGIPVIVTGAEDIITDGVKGFTVSNGNPLLTKVTGAGCLLSSVVGAFLAVGEDSLEAAAAAVSAYGVAAEIAVADGNGPGTFQPAFLDSLYLITEKILEKKATINEWIESEIVHE